MQRYCRLPSGSELQRMMMNAMGSPGGGVNMESEAAAGTSEEPHLHSVYSGSYNINTPASQPYRQPVVETDNSLSTSTPNFNANSHCQFKRSLSRVFYESEGTTATSWEFCGVSSIDNSGSDCSTPPAVSPPPPVSSTPTPSTSCLSSNNNNNNHYQRRPQRQYHHHHHYHHHLPSRETIRSQDSSAGMYGQTSPMPAVVEASQSPVYHHHVHHRSIPSPHSAPGTSSAARLQEELNDGSRNSTGSSTGSHRSQDSGFSDSGEGIRLFQRRQQQLSSLTGSKSLTQSPPPCNSEVDSNSGSPLHQQGQGTLLVNLCCAQVPLLSSQSQSQSASMHSYQKCEKSPSPVGRKCDGGGGGWYHPTNSRTYVHERSYSSPVSAVPVAHGSSGNYADGDRVLRQNNSATFTIANGSRDGSGYAPIGIIPEINGNAESQWSGNCVYQEISNPQSPSSYCQCHSHQQQHSKGQLYYSSCHQQQRQQSISPSGSGNCTGKNLSPSAGAGSRGEGVYEDTYHSPCTAVDVPGTCDQFGAPIYSSTPKRLNLNINVSSIPLPNTTLKNCSGGSSSGHSSNNSTTTIMKKIDNFESLNKNMRSLDNNNNASTYSSVVSNSLSPHSASSSSPRPSLAEGGSRSKGSQQKQSKVSTTPTTSSTSLLISATSIPFIEKFSKSKKKSTTSSPPSLSCATSTSTIPTMGSSSASSCSSQVTVALSPPKYQNPPPVVADTSGRQSANGMMRRGPLPLPPRPSSSPQSSSTGATGSLNFTRGEADDTSSLLYATCPAIKLTSSHSETHPHNSLNDSYYSQNYHHHPYKQPSSDFNLSNPNFPSSSLSTSQLGYTSIDSPSINDNNNNGMLPKGFKRVSAKDLASCYTTSSNANNRGSSSNDRATTTTPMPTATSSSSDGEMVIVKSHFENDSMRQWLHELKFQAEHECFYMLQTKSVQLIYDEKLEQKKNEAQNSDSDSGTYGSSSSSTTAAKTVEATTSKSSSANAGTASKKKRKQMQQQAEHNRRIIQTIHSLSAPISSIKNVEHMANIVSHEFAKICKNIEFGFLSQVPPFVLKLIQYVEQFLETIQSPSSPSSSSSSSSAASSGYASSTTANNGNMYGHGNLQKTEGRLARACKRLDRSAKAMLGEVSAKANGESGRKDLDPRSVYSIIESENMQRGETYHVAVSEVVDGVVSVGNLFSQVVDMRLTRDLSCILDVIEGSGGPIPAKVALRAFITILLEGGNHLCRLASEIRTVRGLLGATLDYGDGDDTLRILALRCLATVLCVGEAVKDFDRASGFEIVADFMYEPIYSFELRIEAVSVLTQATDPWIDLETSLSTLGANLEKIVIALTNLVPTCHNYTEEPFLLVVAALSNLSFLEVSSMELMRRCNTVSLIINVVQTPGLNFSLFVLDHVATILANMAGVESCRDCIVKSGGVYALLNLLQVSPSPKVETAAEIMACERVQQKSTIALSRLCGEEGVAQLVLENGGIQRLIHLSRNEKERNYSDGVLIAALATLRKIVGVCGDEAVIGLQADDLIQPRLLDSFLLYSSRQESYV